MERERRAVKRARQMRREGRKGKGGEGRMYVWIC